MPLFLFFNNNATWIIIIKQKLHILDFTYSFFPEYNISAAAIAVFSLAFIILGTLCLLGSLRKDKDYLHKPAGMFYAFAGKMTSV